LRPIIAKITLDNRTAIIEAHPDSIEYIANFFKVLDTSKCWVYGKFRKELAVSVSFLTLSENNPTGALLPIGLVPTLIKVLDKLKAKYKIIDERRVDEWNFTDEKIMNILYNENNDIILRDYQLDAVKAMLAHKNGTIKAGTGAGKSEIFAAWVKLTEKKTLIAFKNIKLAKEIVARMMKANIDIGLVQGTNVDEEHQVVACTVQSAHKLNRIDYEVIFVDESHNSSQGRYQALLTRYDFEYRFGFSATPFNKSNKLKTYKVKAWLGDIIYDKPAKELIDQGYLVKPIITFLKVNKVINNVKRQKTTKLLDEDGIPRRDELGNLIKETKVWYEQVEKNIEDKQWATAERLGIVYNVYRNKMIKTLANSLPGTVLALVKYVDSHGAKLHNVMEDALFLSGKDKVKDRELAVEMLENNEIKTIIASTIFDEGVDLKRVNNILIIGGGQSYEKTLQRIGRGMRKFTDENGVEKVDVKVYDFYDATHPVLERHSKARIKYAEAEGYEVIIKEINLPDF